MLIPRHLLKTEILQIAQIHKANKLLSKLFILDLACVRGVTFSLLVTGELFFIKFNFFKISFRIFVSSWKEHYFVKIITLDLPEAAH